MGNAPIDDPQVDAIAETHARRIQAALARMSVRDVRQLVDEIETEIGPAETGILRRRP